MDEKIESASEVKEEQSPTKEPAFYREELKRQAAKTAQIQAEYEKMKAAVEAEKKANEEKVLKEAGDYKTLAEKAAQAIKDSEERARKLEREYGIKDALRTAGVNHPAIIRTAIQDYTGDGSDYASYAQAILESPENAVFRTKPEDEKPRGNPAPSHGSPRTNNQSLSLEERHSRGDRDATREMFNKIIGG